MESRPLYQPPLAEICSVLVKALSSNFAQVDVAVVDCPNLSEAPFKLAAVGLGGKSAIADIGGVNNMEYVSNNNKFHFDIENICEKVEIPGGFVLGAAATKPDCSASKDNSELMPCIHVGTAKNNSKEAYVDKQTNQPVLADYSSHEVSSLANLLICEGSSGPVIKVRAAVRTGELNFVTCMRKALTDHYPDQQIGMAGSFVIEKGTFKSHIMPTFPPRDAPGDGFWLAYFSTPAPVTCLSVFVSQDTHKDDLRLEHTHFWAHDGSTGGHYHYDTSPDQIIYEGYFTLAEKLFRIGRAYAPSK